MKPFYCFLALAWIALVSGCTAQGIQRNYILSEIESQEKSVIEQPQVSLR